MEFENVLYPGGSRIAQLEKGHLRNGTGGQRCRAGTEAIRGDKVAQGLAVAFERTLPEYSSGWAKDSPHSQLEQEIKR